VNNKAIRDTDIAWFRKILVDSGSRAPKDLDPYLPELLWMFQMGVIYFWVTDDSPEQRRTARLLALGARIVTTLLKIAYWTLWSQAIIHRIHMRVLTHIKNLSESDKSAGDMPADASEISALRLFRSPSGAGEFSPVQ
jgi:Tetracyclin repressor-like, C-terminal domain